MSPMIVALALLPRAQAQAWSVMSYNAQFRPYVAGIELGNTPGSNRDTYGMSDTRRAKKVGDLVHSLPALREGVGPGPDIVLFQEVFEKDAFDALVATLSDHPYHTEHPLGFDGQTTDELLDWGHGMALFSRWPFQSLGDLPSWECAARDDVGDCVVEFHEFHVHDELFSGENAAGKGVMYARIDNPATGRLLHVFGTHLHAGSPYGDEDCEVDGVLVSDNEGPASCARLQQMHELVTFIDSRAPLGKEGDVVLLGDLNVRGAREPLDALEDGSETLALEWIDRVELDLGALAIEDLRLRQPSTASHLTFDGERSTVVTSDARDRFDYVLARAESRDKGADPLCPSHLVVEQGFEGDDDAGWPRDLSDHFPVHVRFGVEAPRCAAGGAELVTGVVDGTIPFPGNVEWYRLPAGTWTVEAARGLHALDVEVFAASDLSVPLAPVGSQTSQIDKGQTPLYHAREEMYVRVQDDPDTVGDYTLFALPNTGATLGDPLHVDPGEVVTPQMTEVNLRLELFPLTSGDDQTVRLVAECSSGEPEFSLFDAAQSPLLTSGPDGDFEGDPSLTPSADDVPLGSDAGLMFARVRCPGGATVTDARYDTDRHTVELTEFQVLNQEAFLDLGVDDLRLSVVVDGTPVDVQDGRTLKLDQGAGVGLGTVVHFVKNVEIEAVEQDGIDQAFAGSIVRPGCAGDPLCRAQVVAAPEADYPTAVSLVPLGLLSGNGAYTVGFRESTR